LLITLTAGPGTDEPTLAGGHGQGRRQRRPKSGPGVAPESPCRWWISCAGATGYITRPSAPIAFGLMRTGEVQWPGSRLIRLDGFAQSRHPRLYQMQRVFV